jgi:hypothetical protein
MGARRIIGVILIVIGLVGLLYGGFTYPREKTVLKVGPIEARERTHETIPFPPIAGGVALVVGILLFVIPSGRRI